MAEVMAGSSKCARHLGVRMCRPTLRYEDGMSGRISSNARSPYPPGAGSSARSSRVNHDSTPSRAVGRGAVCLKFGTRPRIAGSRRGDTQYIGSIGGGNPLDALPAPWIDGARLPCRPIWSGFALNTLIFSAAWLLAVRLLRSPFLARWAVRRRRGLCGGCGYILNDAVRCSECGTTADAAVAWTWRRERAVVVTAGAGIACCLALFVTLFRLFDPTRPCTRRPITATSVGWRR